MIQIQLMQMIKFNIKNIMKVMDEEKFPAQCHPVIKSKKKKSKEVKIETM